MFSTMYGLGSVLASFGVVVGVLFPWRTFLKEIPPFLCFYCVSVFLVELLPMLPPIRFVLL